jgi:glutamyl-tRNA synthetase
MTIVTRFAPSPTGLLHIGGARTALFNYIFAKSKKGIFKIRIEDTDKSRYIEKSVGSILNDLKWLGIETKEKIIYQSDNKKKHNNVIERMIEDGLAYRCYHSEEELNEKRKKNKKFKSEWRDKKIPKSDTENFCVRIKSPENGVSTINDQIQGTVELKNNEIDDFIIKRSDGTPTFLISSALDDYEMSITHIIRGDDHLTNSFRQLEIFKYLNYKPIFSHMSLIHNQNNQKLSKRDNIISINDYKKKGFLKESLINYMLRMGWSYGNNEIITLNEAIEHFTLDKVGKSPSMIDEKKLLFLNNYFINNIEEKDLFERIKIIDGKNSDLDSKLKQKKFQLIKIFKPRSSTTIEIQDKIYNIFSNKKNFNNEEENVLEIFYKNKSFIIDEFTSIKEWNEYIIDQKLKDILNKLEIKFKELGQPLRLLLTNSLNGPSVAKIMEIIGKELSLKKLNHS